MIDGQTSERLQWLADLYSHNPEAITEEVADSHLFDRQNDFGIQQFLDSFRPLAKLREQRGDLKFKIGKVIEEADDLLYAEMLVDDELIYIARVRIEAEQPSRIKYWSSYPPLPEGVTLRAYQQDDAPGCVALEQLCPFESKDGTLWTIDRGTAFHDYLALMAPVDASVAELDGEIVGFFSCALRPIRFNNESCYAVYQHHYRVHPNHRSGSVSVALASHVDPRRTFESLPVPFPYSMIDPENLHMQNMGFPPVPDVRLARLSLPVSTLVNAQTTQAATVSAAQATEAEILALLQHTHKERLLFPDITGNFLHERWSRTKGFGLENYRSTADAVVGIWEAGELNRIERNGQVETKRLAFVVDYGFVNTETLLQLLKVCAGSMADTNITHLCLLCDTRAEEYSQLREYADDEALLAFHTLPWICEPLAAGALYCDGLYF